MSLKCVRDHIISLRSCPRRAWYIFSQITSKKARIWLFFRLGRKQYGWFALFRLAKTPPSVSCCWFSSAFLLAYWAVNTHASSLWNVCRLRFNFLPDWKMYKYKFHPLKYFLFHRMLKIAVKNSPIIWMQFDTGYKLQKRRTSSLFIPD